ncbi:MAG TPA: LysM peptidoglycan-binding domain-containing protein [Solirubrobacteraceae bacterium]|nr:LysM peptidoglycan-binding domain-containing protein [Solirubrobacteraceae bacterium]
MRTWKPFVLLLTISAAAWAPATASAAFQHVVSAGETLSSVAAADGLTISQLAAANGISPDAPLVEGASLAIPPQGATVASSAAASSGSVGSSESAGGGTDTDTGQAAAPSSSGGYVVQPGDTLSAIAARLGVTVSSLAASNGLTPSGVLLSGTTLHASGGTSQATAGATTQTAAPATSSTAGGYQVQPGDTLSAIAARYGVSVNSLASLNGLSPSGVLLSGTTLHVGSASASAPASTEMVSTTSPAASSGAQPTGQTVTSGEVGSIAAAEGVPPSLAEAIGYQESGFNNGMVSPTGATGVMQIMPGTWNYIGANLAGPPPLSPTSASDNIRAGSLLLHQLLQQSGGDPAMAAAGYYQGMQSVRQHGLFPDTRAYVNNVMALRQRFGG